EYLGDSTYAPSSSTSMSHVVSTGTVASVDVVPNPDPAVAGRDNKLTAVVVGSGDPNVRPRGVIAFTDENDDTLGTAALKADGTATLTVNSFVEGQISVTATFLGGVDVNYPSEVDSSPITLDVEEPLDLETSVD